MDAILLTGAVGAGKTTVAATLSDLLLERGVVHAVLDMDEIRRLRPPPAGDPFQLQVAMTNLASMAANFRDAGATLLIVAGVIEGSRDLALHRSAVGAGSTRVVRLTATPGALQSRLRGRHADDDETVRAWHAARAVELTTILDAADLADLEVDTTDRTPREVAELIEAQHRSA